jgi:hypothetical protein
MFHQPCGQDKPREPCSPAILSRSNHQGPTTLTSARPPSLPPHSLLDLLAGRRKAVTGSVLVSRGGLPVGGTSLGYCVQGDALLGEEGRTREESVLDHTLYWMYSHGSLMLSRSTVVMWCPWLAAGSSSHSRCHGAAVHVEPCPTNKRPLPFPCTPQGTLTVRESIRFSAELRLPGGMAPKDRAHRVEVRAYAVLASLVLVIITGSVLVGIMSMMMMILNTLVSAWPSSADYEIIIITFSVPVALFLVLPLRSCGVWQRVIAELGLSKVGDSLIGNQLFRGISGGASPGRGMVIIVTTRWCDGRQFWFTLL